MNLATTILVLAAVPQSPQGADPWRSKELAFASLGVSLESSPLPDGPARHGLVVPNFFRSAWLEAKADGSRPHFAAWPWSDPFFDSLVGSKDAKPDDLDSRVPCLVLENVGATSKARGTVLLEAPPTLGDGDPFRIDVVRSGCSMRNLFETPLLSSNGRISLDFEWDLHTWVDPTGRSLALEGSGLPVEQVPIVLKTAHMPVHVDRYVHVGGDHGEALKGNLRLSCETAMEILHVQAPACVRIESESVGAKEAVFTVQEASATGALQHECGAIMFKLKVGDDAEPYYRAVSVRHDGPIHDAEGRRILAGRFGNRELVSLWKSDDGAVRLSFPDRIRCAESLLLEAGYQRLGEVRMPEEAGPVERILPTEEGVYRIVGTCCPRAFDHADAWDRACR